MDTAPLITVSRRHQRGGDQAVVSSREKRFAVVECRAAFDIGWTVADSGPFKCLWYTVQQRWIIFHSSACYQSRCEVKGKRRQRPACSAQHAALTLEVSHPLLEGGKMAWLNTKNFSRAISWDRCENLVLELVLWPATVGILWRLFVHRFFVLVAPLKLYLHCKWDWPHFAFSSQRCI